MARVALIKDGVVDIVIEASLEYASTLGYDHCVESYECNAGWLYVDGELINPNPVEEPAADYDPHVELP